MLDGAIRADSPDTGGGGSWCAGGSGGGIVLNEEAVYKKLKFYQNAAGAVPGGLPARR